MADTLKCPNCGANLILNADTQMLECMSCGASLDPATLQITVDELEAKPVEAEAEAPVQSQPEQQQVQAQAQAQPESQPATEDVSDEGSGEQTEFVCNSCGAKLVTDSHTAATFCAFCGSPALVGKRLTEKFQPQYMIPFKYSREYAEKEFIKWAGKGRWTPFGFVSKKNISKITGLYVPFWLFNIDANIDVEGTGTNSYVSGQYRITDTFSFTRKGHLRWENIPLDGETRVDDQLMEAIEPFYFDALIPYNYKFLPGFYADKYDLSPQDLAARATKRGINGIDQAIKDSLRGKYDTHRFTSNKSSLAGMEANYALLPVWFLSYKYNNKYYYFAMNGQTGEVAGNLPASPVKKTMFFFLMLGIFAVVARLLLGLVMRGIWG